MTTRNSRYLNEDCLVLVKDRYQVYADTLMMKARYMAFVTNALRQAKLIN